MDQDQQKTRVGETKKRKLSFAHSPAQASAKSTHVRDPGRAGLHMHFLKNPNPNLYSHSERAVRLLRNNKMIYDTPVRVVELSVFQGRRIVCNHLAVPECKALLSSCRNCTAIFARTMFPKRIQAWWTSIPCRDVHRASRVIEVLLDRLRARRATFSPDVGGPVVVFKESDDVIILEHAVRQHAVARLFSFSPSSFFFF